MSQALPQPSRLITIRFSHFCEKARWALDHHGAAYREEGHAPVFHIVASRRAGGGRSTPVLIEGGQVFPDSTAILEHLDRGADESRRLYPAIPEAAAEVRALEELFGDVLGPDARRFGYFHVLKEPQVIRRAVQVGVPAREHLVFRAIFPVVRHIMRSRMRIDAEGARRSAERMEEVLVRVETRLASGARYLVGDAFSAADLTFAALFGALVLPPESPSPFPRFEGMPAPIQAVLRPYRERPAGRFVLRLYREHRLPAAATPPLPRI